MEYSHYYLISIVIKRQLANYS